MTGSVVDGTIDSSRIAATSIITNLTTGEARFGFPRGKPMVDVGAVLSSALNAGLQDVMVVGRLPNGEPYVAASCDAQTAQKMVDALPAYYEFLEKSKV